MSTIGNTLLKAYYPNLTFLFDFLQPHLDVNIELLKEEDEEEYKKFLTTSVISADTTKEFPRVTKEKQELVPKKNTGLDFTINQAIAILVNRTDKRSATNVMRLGSTKQRTLNSQGFSLTDNNSTVDYMRKSRTWLKLYMRIGQEAMVFLLTNFSMFLELQNGCYVQLAGPAVSKLSVPKNSPHPKDRNKISEVVGSQIDTSSTYFSSQNEDTQISTQDGPNNTSQSDLPDNHAISWKSLSSQDINPISKRKSDVLSFFRKLRDEENKNYSQNYSSSAPLSSCEISSQNSNPNMLFFSQNTHEIGLQSTTSSICQYGNAQVSTIDIDENDPSSIEYNMISNNNTPSKCTKLNDEKMKAMHLDTRVENIASSHVKQKTEGENITSNLVEQKTGDTTPSYAKFKQQTRGAFLKIMEVMHPDKVAKEEEIESNHVGDEPTVLNENINSDTQKKHPIDDIQETSSKAIILNNRDVVKMCNTNTLTNLCFSRATMFFSPPEYNKYGELWYGLPKDHILNLAKISKKDNISYTVINHIFPRQFGLRNVFTSGNVSPPGTRKKELNNSHCEIPDRLRCLLPYVDHIIKRHNSCKYKNLLNTHCTIQAADETNADRTNADGDSPGYCNTFQVAKFVKAVLDFIIPLEFWGDKNNKTVIYKMVKTFIERRRFEVLSLHEILQGFKVTKCEWLVPPGSKKSCNNLEALKRTEVLHEFIWWIFECFVTPLLKLNFHITHNAKYKCRLFYYRQEVWLEMFKQGLEPLTNSVFEEIPSEKVAEVLKDKTLGYSKVKFIPKDDEGNLRPIVDMSCPMHKAVGPSTKTTHKDSKRSQSVNALLNTTFQILKYEKENNPLLLSGSVFSYNEVHECLKQYKQYLANKDGCELYFAKVDAKCCFESIDQDKLMEIIRANVFTETQYVVNRYDAVHSKGGDIRKRHKHYVHNGEDFISFPEYATELAQKYKNVILIENVKETYKDLEDVLGQLEEHIQQNIIKAGNKYYRQTVGIPQGSTLSSLLCSIYYGVMERSELQFVKDDNGVLLHLLDDFLYISTNKENVIKFITAMHHGHPKYRCIVNNKKSMVNFDLEIFGEKITKVDHSGDFPWCGLLINTHTLNVKADYSRYVPSNIADTLTIKTTRNPGEFLKQKMLEFVTTKCHQIFYDILLNTRSNILLNIYQNFLIAAMKFHHYVKGMPKQGFQRNENFEAEVVHNTIKSVFNVLCKIGNQGKCTFNVSQMEVMWLGAHAFYCILIKKQNYHQGVLTHFKQIIEDFQLNTTQLLNSIVDWNFSLVFNEMKF